MRIIIPLLRKEGQGVVDNPQAKSNEKSTPPNLPFLRGGIHLSTLTNTDSIIVVMILIIS